MKTTVIDVHTHLGVNPSFHIPVHQWKDILKHMDQLGIDLIIQAHQSMMGADWENGEKESLQAFEGSNKRIYSYVPFNPNDPKAIQRAEKLFSLPAFIGIKIHPSFHGVYADDLLYEPAWQVAKEFNVPILTHSYDRTAARPSHQLSWVMLFEKWLWKFPEVKLILGHSGGLPQGHRESVRLARKYPNVYLDTAGDTFSFDFIEWVVNEIGSERLLYGSDLDWIDSRAHLFRIIASSIDLKDKKYILGMNTAAIFNLTA